MPQYRPLIVCRAVLVGTAYAGFLLMSMPASVLTVYTTRKNSYVVRLYSLQKKPKLQLFGRNSENIAGLRGAH